MKVSQRPKAIAMLWLTAAIWGFAFVAQRAGMVHVGPFIFNGLRFLLGSLSLLPLIFWLNHREKKKVLLISPGLFRGGLAAGIVLFVAASLQQAGIVYTQAGKAGFITGLYVLIVPAIGIFLGQITGRNLWIGAAVAVAGLFLLAFRGPLIIEKGDLLVLVSAFFWAVHVQLINSLVKKLPALPLSAMQFAICGILSLAVSSFFETTLPGDIFKASVPLLYGGLLSVGVAYTLQVVAQKYVHPAYASIILSFETVFAVIGGWLILHESMTFRNLAGCLLMLTGILIVQVKDFPMGRKRNQKFQH
ncbi:MAG TPA: DMT family transporter [Bacteroidales bacterium]|nr:DMT family transporter [Bacteroidales bacterium]HPT01738.1 DMT family transporter [Bacteroidales bacterium]